MLRRRRATSLSAPGKRATGEEGEAYCKVRDRSPRFPAAILLSRDGTKMGVCPILAQCMTKESQLGFCKLRRFQVWRLRHQHHSQAKQRHEVIAVPASSRQTQDRGRAQTLSGGRLRGNKHLSDGRRSREGRQRITPSLYLRIAADGVQHHPPPFNCTAKKAPGAMGIGLPMMISLESFNSLLAYV